MVELRESSIIDVMEDPKFLRPLLARDDEDMESWACWKVALKLAYGIRLKHDPKDEKNLIKTNAFDFDNTGGWQGTELELAIECTGGAITEAQEHVGRGFRRVYFIVGRRGGKSKIISVINIYQASFRDYSRMLSLGEKGRVLTVAPSLDQGEIILDYCAAGYELDCLSDQLDKRGNRAEGRVVVGQKIKILKNTFGSKITLQVMAANARTVRGPTMVAAILEELAFWYQEANYANPDYEILAAITPSMATIKHGKIFGISSPYSQQGVLYEKYVKHYGVVGSTTLVWKAPTWVMNPEIDREFLEEEREDDPASFKCEYGAEFRSDIAAFISMELVKGMVDPGVTVRPYSSNYKYSAFVDPSGGSVDDMTLGIWHTEQRDGVEMRIEDVNLAVKPQFSPQNDAVPLFAETMKEFRIGSCIGDNYGGAIFKSEFKKHGITYQPPKVVETEIVENKKKKKSRYLSRSDIYTDALPWLNSGQAVLLDINEKNKQIWNLERRTGRGKDIIDHPKGKHDDMANAALGGLVFVGNSRRKSRLFYA